MARHRTWLLRCPKGHESLIWFTYTPPEGSRCTHGEESEHPPWSDGCPEHREVVGPVRTQDCSMNKTTSCKEDCLACFPFADLVKESL